MIKIRIAMVGIVLMFCVLYGCTKKAAPGCGDERTTNLVLSISRDELKRQLRTTTQTRESRTITDSQWEKEWLAISNGLKLSLDMVATTDVNEKVGSHYCSAHLIIATHNDKTPLQIPITFTSELDAGNESRFIVNVKGLE